MGLTLNNKTLSRASEIIFANDTSYHVELPMAGREGESQTMDEALAVCDGPRTVTMTASLGAGKTFFLNKMINAHAKRNPGFDERRNCQFVFATDDEPPVDTDAATSVRNQEVEKAVEALEHGFDGVSGLRVLIVEELDRKASLDQLLWSVDTATRWLAVGGDRLLILTGEALALHALQQRLTNIDTCFDITLKSLDLELLKEALTLRIAEKLIMPTRDKMSEDDAKSLARAATDAILLDEYVRWAAVPLADPRALANFREALGALGKLAAAVRVDNEARVEFPRQLVEHFRGQAQCAGAAGRLEAAILADLTVRIASGKAITALSTDDLAALIERESDPKFRRRAVEPLATKGLLTPLGVPYSQSDEAGRALMYADPFMPSYSLIQRALADLVSGSREVA